MRFVANYTKGWSGPDLEYHDFRDKVMEDSAHRTAPYSIGQLYVRL